MHEDKRLKHAANIALVLSIIIMFSLGLLIGFKFAPKPMQEIIYKAPEEKVAILSIPAVNDAGQGIMTKLTARMKEGSGDILVNVGNVVSGYEMQLSARKAVEVIENLTRIDLSSYDISYSIETDASIVDGRSASAAMAVSILSLLENKQLNPKATITGSIEDGGLIGNVGMVEAKAIAARNSGFEVIAVPFGQGRDIEQVEKIVCKSESLEFCKVEYMPKISVANFGGIQVKEVNNIRDALKWLEEGSLAKYAAESIEAEQAAKKREERQHIPIEQLGLSGISIDDYTLMDVQISGTLVILRLGCTAIALSTDEPTDSVVNGIQSSIIGRPNTHDVVKTSYDIFNIDIPAILIDRFDSGIYYAQIIMIQDNKVLSLDSRPSDALALGSRFNSPVYLKNEIFASQGKAVC